MFALTQSAAKENQSLAVSGNVHAADFVKAADGRLVGAISPANTSRMLQVRLSESLLLPQRACASAEH